MTRPPIAVALVLGAALAAVRCGEPPRPTTARPAGEPVIAIVGATVLPLETTAALADHTVIVRGDRIERVAPRAEVAVPDGARVIDGRGRYLIPGLMDMHVHLARTQDLAIMLALGVTTARNMWGAPIHLAWRDRIARGELIGPAIITAGPILDGEHPAHPGSMIVRSEADADRAIALHRRLGYDFVKVYSGLSAPVFDRLIAGAARAGLPVAGHVPWAVTLEHASAGMRSVEHLSGFLAALQAADSPVAGRSDGRSRRRQIDHVDEARLGAVVHQLAAHHTFDVPTRSVRDSAGGADEVRRMLALPEMRWLPPCERALAEPGPDDPEDLERHRRAIALFDRIVRALDEAGAPIAAGTDLQNPLQIPGFTLHRELALLVGAGLSPLAALRAATHRGAELVGRSDLGGIAAGMRADLVLLDGDPLADIHNTRRIAGVMARGRYYPRGELDAILARIAAEFAGPQDAFGGAPALRVEHELFRADYDVTWRDIAFGNERVAVGGRGDERAVVIESADLHQGTITRARWQSGADQLGASLAIDVDGATGRGHLDVRRDGGALHARGTSLPGIAAALDAAIPADTLLAPDAMLSRVVVLRSRLQPLAVGQVLELRERAIGLGSEIDADDTALRVRRLDDRPEDAGARIYEITRSRGPRAELVVDPAGWPVELVSQDHGATLRLRRRPR